MLFGEIVEPTTRALIDDELEDIPDYKEPVIEWEGTKEPPNDINTLIFADTEKILNICKCAVSSRAPIAKLKDGLEIFKIDKKYIVLFSGNKNLAIGEIVEALSSWLLKAKNIVAITSGSKTLLQNHREDLEIITVLKCLTNEASVPFNFCMKLEPPNMVHGFGASILSYCIHRNLKCSLFIAYMDNMPLDSVNSKPIVELLRKLGFDVTPEFRVSDMSSNLYM